MYYNNLKFLIRRSLYLYFTSIPCSLNKNFEELQNLLQSTNITFDVIAITESRIPKNVSVT